MTNIDPTTIPTQPEPEKPKATLSDEAYSLLKNLAQVWLPAAATLYAALGAIWGVPAVTQVLATIVTVDTFLGVVLKISTSNYNNSDAPFDGTFNVQTNPDTSKQTVSLVLNGDPADIVNADKVAFKVQTVPSVAPTELQTDPAHNITPGDSPPVDN